MASGSKVAVSTSSRSREAPATACPVWSAMTLDPQKVTAVPSGAVSVPMRLAAASGMMLAAAWPRITASQCGWLS